MTPFDVPKVIGAGILLSLLFALYSALLIRLRRRTPDPPKIALTTAMFVLLALVSYGVTRWVSPPSLSLTPTPSQPKTITPTASPSRTPQPSPTPTPTPTPPLIPQAGIGVAIAEPSEGDLPSPQFIVSGQYQNLKAGWSIHVLIQDLDRPGRYFAAPHAFVVPAASSTGDWSIRVSLTEFLPLNTQKDFNLSAVVCLSVSAREALSRATVQGVTSLPESALTFPQVVTVRRAGYSQRIFFSLLRDGQHDLASVRPDGSDLRRHTETPDIDEYYPDLSPDGASLAYVEVRHPQDEPESWALVTASIDGAIRKVLLEQRGVKYERPSWSPDGRLLAFAATLSQFKDTYGIFVIDPKDSSTHIVSLQQNNSKHPDWLSSTCVIYQSLIRTPGAASKTWGLVSADIAGSGLPQTVYDTPGEEFSPAVSIAEPNIVAFVYWPEADPAVGQHIMILDMRSGDVTNLTPAPTGVWNPSWDVRGKHVYYQRSYPGNAIFMLTLDPRSDMRITRQASDASYPSVGLVLSAILDTN